MKFKKEFKKIRRLSKRLMKYLYKKAIIVNNFIISQCKSLISYIKKLQKDPVFRDIELKKGIRKLKSQQKIKVEAKLILNKKLDEDSMNIGRKPIIIGIWFSFLLLGSFLIWSVTAQVNSTAIANGKIVVDSNKKIIQHLEGGIIEKIYVKGGDRIEAGDSLIRLSETSAKANQELLSKQLFALKAAKIRLISQRDDKEFIDFSEIANKYQNDVEFIKILDGERELFKIRRKSLRERIDILRQKIEQLKDEIEGLRYQESSVAQRIKMISEESGSLDKLYEESIISKTRYLELKKQTAELEGNRGQFTSNISKVSQAISETELEIANIKTEKLNETLKELQEVQTKNC